MVLNLRRQMMLSGLETWGNQKNKTTNTICDGLRAQIGLTFPIIKEK